MVIVLLISCSVLHMFKKVPVLAIDLGERFAHFIMHSCVIIHSLLILL